MFYPAATYRVQLNSQFTLRHLQQIIPYLHQLGISTVYAAPLMQSANDSVHGYDVMNPDMINPQIGTVEELELIARQLRQFGMHWLQDIVPNHMVFSTANTRMADVLERGPQSPYYHYFDIDWDHPDPSLNGRLMLPFIGTEPEEAIQRKEIQLAQTPGGPAVVYAGNAYPLAINSWRMIIAVAGENINATSLHVLNELVEQSIQQAASLSFSQWQMYKQELLHKIQEETTLLQLLQQCMAHINDHPPLLKQLLQQQHYTLTWWRNTEQQINYRRFFTVNSLICLRMGDEAVFTDYHQRIFSLYKQGLINGLRIDHIDGLYNPQQYLDRLRKALGDECYIIAEKILGNNEILPAEWRLQGTSGYEFLSFTNQLLTDQHGAEKLRRFYKELVPGMPDYQELVFYCKHRFLLEQMNGELDNLLHYLDALELTAGIQTPQLRDALAIWMAAFPVYRIYPNGFPLEEAEQEPVRQAFETAIRNAPELQQGWMILQSLFDAGTDPDFAERKNKFLMRLMQFTGPLAAKGVEDTCFYLYNPLIAHNEVGDSPAQLGDSIEHFHSKMQSRQQNNPYSLNATSTHDTKRGEDARLRIGALSILADEWIAKVSEWMQLNEPLVQYRGVRRMPSVNDEYFIYQSLIGSAPPSGEITDDWLERTRQFIVKAVREGKKESNYIQPDTVYEEACTRFITALLQPDHAFRQSFFSFLGEVLVYACNHSLAETLIKITAPGIPDFYQGAELWNTSYVDPDNRLPVDYTARMQALEILKQKQAEGFAELLPWLEQHKQQGLQKMFVIRRMLDFRSKNNLLFLKGSYIPLTVSENRTALAYARHFNGKWICICIPLGRAAGYTASGNLPDAIIRLPENSASSWVNLFTGETIQLTGNSISLRQLLERFPVACLMAT